MYLLTSNFIGFDNFELLHYHERLQKSIKIAKDSVDNGLLSISKCSIGVEVILY